MTTTEQATQEALKQAREAGSRGDRSKGDDSDCFALTEVEILDILQSFGDALSAHSGVVTSDPRAGLWLPIETAPKDGMPVMLFYPKGNQAGMAEIGMYRRSIQVGREKNLEGWRYLRSHSAAYDLDHQPTLWMPLPPGPRAENGQAPS